MYEAGIWIIGAAAGCVVGILIAVIGPRIEKWMEKPSYKRELRKLKTKRKWLAIEMFLLGSPVDYVMDKTGLTEAEIDEVLKS